MKYLVGFILFLLMPVLGHSACVYSDVVVGEPTGIYSLTELYLDNDGTNTSTSSGCSLVCNSFRLKSQNIDINKALAVALSAKTLGKKVRIDLIDNAACGRAYRIYINE